MTNSDLTLIAILVDRSGSMQTCQSDMQGGINTFLKEQAEQPGLLDVTLAQFDDRYEKVWTPTRISADHVPQYSLVPRGMTALLDGMGKFITETGEYLAGLQESARPGKVIFMVVTDGLENASREWTKFRIKQLVEQQQAIYKWEFTFLGANMDAIAEGGSLGFTRGASMTFDVSNSQQVFAAASSNMTAYRSGLSNNVSYSDQQREDALNK